MDYTAIINLALVTIIYSTFVAPNLKKMGDLRADISNTEFPLIDNSAGNKQSILDEIKKKGTAINKKMAQYLAVYNETKKFLIVFYITIVIVLAVQLVITAMNKKLLLEVNEINLYYLLAVIVVILLHISLKLSMIKPDKLRTMSWLYSIGISEVYSRLIYGPSLWINYSLRNLAKENKGANMAITSEIKLHGNRIIAVIESDKGDKLYKVVAGVLNPQARGIRAFSQNGTVRSVTDLFFNLSLKPGKYNARLLYFGSLFSGINTPYEVLKDFTVTNAAFSSSNTKMDLSEESANFTYEANKKGTPIKIDFQYDNDNVSVGMRTLLDSKKFQKKFSKTKHLFEITNSHIGLSTQDIDMKLRTMNYVRSSIKLLQTKFTSKRSKNRNIIL